MSLTGIQLASGQYPSSSIGFVEFDTSGFLTLANLYGHGHALFWLEPPVAVIAIGLAGCLLLFGRKPVLTTGVLAT